MIPDSSTRDQKVTKPDFRPCSTSMSRSQAPLCHYTLRLTSIQPEGTFGRLRYLLGGDRPSQTAHQALSPAYAGLGGRLGKSGISRLAPSDPETGVRSLPPILRIPGPPSTPSYSKAPRGLFVLQRVTSIFTGPAISPSPPLRQCPSRDAFRAGRNLPDKEFRYLRTVIVTAAVYRRFGSEREPLPLTFRHWAGVSPYTSACALAGTCVFGKQSLGPILCHPFPLTWRARSRYWGPPSPEVTGSICRIP